jgi:hypothetical protein
MLVIASASTAWAQLHPNVQQVTGQDIIGNNGTLARMYHNAPIVLTSFQEALEVKLLLGGNVDPISGTIPEYYWLTNSGDETKKPIVTITTVKGSVPIRDTSTGQTSTSITLAFGETGLLTQEFSDSGGNAVVNFTRYNSATITQPIPVAKSNAIGGILSSGDLSVDSNGKPSVISFDVTHGMVTGKPQQLADVVNKEYSDDQDAATLASAKSYSDGKLADYGKRGAFLVNSSATSTLGSFNNGDWFAYNANQSQTVNIPSIASIISAGTPVGSSIRITNWQRTFPATTLTLNFSDPIYPNPADQQPTGKTFVMNQGDTYEFKFTQGAWYGQRVSGNLNGKVTVTNGATWNITSFNDGDIYIAWSGTNTINLPTTAQMSSAGVKNGYRLKVINYLPTPVTVNATAGCGGIGPNMNCPITLAFGEGAEFVVDSSSFRSYPFIAQKMFSASATAPANMGTTQVGYMWFDTAIGKPRWWSGTAWVDAMPASKTDGSSRSLATNTRSGSMFFTAGSSNVVFTVPAASTIQTLENGYNFTIQALMKSGSKITVNLSDSTIIYDSVSGYKNVKTLDIMGGNEVNFYWDGGNKQWLTRQSKIGDASN